MFDVLGSIETGGNLQTQNLDVKAAASLDVVALQCAVGKSLRQVPASRKALAGQRRVPMAGGVGAAVQRAAGIVMLDLKVITAGLAKIDRVGKMGALRLGDLA